MGDSELGLPLLDRLHLQRSSAAAGTGEIGYGYSNRDNEVMIKPYHKLAAKASSINMLECFSVRASREA